MNNFTFQQRRPLGFILAALCVLSLALTGCEPLRKKFTRKKKEEARGIEPILTPIDYGTPQISPQERYAQHYSLWKVWHADLIEAINEEGSDKKQRYVFSQMLVQLEEMKKWVAEEKQEQLTAFIEETASLEKELDKPAALRNNFSFRKKLELVGKKIRGSLSPKAIAHSENQTHEKVD